MAPEREWTWDEDGEDGRWSSFPCQCGDPLTPGTHRTYGVCEHLPPDQAN